MVSIRRPEASSDLDPSHLCRHAPAVPALLGTLPPLNSFVCVLGCVRWGVMGGGIGGGVDGVTQIMPHHTAYLHSAPNSNIDTVATVAAAGRFRFVLYFPQRHVFLPSLT